MTPKDNLRQLRQALMAARQRRVAATLAGNAPASAEPRLRRVQQMVEGVERVLGLARPPRRPAPLTGYDD